MTRSRSSMWRPVRFTLMLVNTSMSKIDNLYHILSKDEVTLKHHNDSSKKMSQSAIAGDTG
jgi:hypothetical protein